MLDYTAYPKPPPCSPSPKSPHLMVLLEKLLNHQSNDGMFLASLLYLTKTAETAAYSYPAADQEATYFISLVLDGGEQLTCTWCNFIPVISNIAMYRGSLPFVCVYNM